MEIRKAERRKAKLRLGMASVSGGGKTYSALMLAFGLGGKVGMIDTENGSGDLYMHLGPYDIIPLTAPYTVAKYREAIKIFEAAGYTTIIIDSISHAWAGEGGLLDKQGKIADTSGNSYTAWRKVTPDHNAFVEAILQSPCHMIATMRSKQEYVQEKNEKTGKTIIRKVGLAPVQRDGMEYEFTLMMDINNEHVATTTKDRTGLFDGQYFKITTDTGKQLLAWLNMGVDAPPPAPKQEEPAPAPSPVALTVQGLLAEIVSAKTPNGQRYGILIKGDARIFSTFSAPVIERANEHKGKEIKITYKISRSGDKEIFDMLGFETVKA